MAIHYRILEGEHLVVAWAVGPVVLDELRAHFDALAGDPSHRPPMRKLVDYRRSELRIGQPFDGYKIARADAFRGERSALVTHDGLEYGRLRVFTAHAEQAGLESRVFRELEPALAWLGVALPPEEIDRLVGYEPS
jgi:hypothetical protein